ncbi:MAG TPA: MgtC/SapB family protein [Flavobacterium sp.]|jgi:putative Mg2+ transporter-C (MgtC) family protein
MLDWTEILLRLLLAAVFGAAVGLERERKEWAVGAGMRTHMMVCLGACLAMMVSSFGFSDIINHPHVSLDPSRVAAQVVSGIGFLGAGTILFLKPATVKGLTTASGLWTIAGIGLATGGGMYFAAVAATLIAIIILWGLQIVQKKFALKGTMKTLRISGSEQLMTTEVLQKLWSVQSVEVSGFTIEKIDKGCAMEISFTTLNKTVMAAMVSELHSLPSVDEIMWH